MIDTTYLKAHRTASSLQVKKVNRAIARPHQRWHEHKASRRTDANGRPLGFFLTAGQISDYTGAAALLGDLPKAKWLLGDRGYNAD